MSILQHTHDRESCLHTITSEFRFYLNTVYRSSVASFLVLGEGGQDPEMYRPKKYMYLYCASERSERAPKKHIFS